MPGTEELSEHWPPKLASSKALEEEEEEEEDISYISYYIYGTHDLMTNHLRLSSLEKYSITAFGSLGRQQPPARE